MMKKLTLLLMLIAGISLQSFSQVNLDEEMMNGSTLMLRTDLVLVYGVDFYGTEYDFIVTIKSFEEGITFDYEMTNENQTKGSISISQEALDGAMMQYNYFAGGAVELKDQTSVWVSSQVFRQLVETGESRISTNSGKDFVSLSGATAGHDYELINKLSDEVFDDISYVYASSEDGENQFWIHLSPYAPIILKMDVGWKIWLKEMRSK